MKKYFFIVSIIIICSLLIYKSLPNEILLFSKIYQIKTISLKEDNVKIFIINLDRSGDRYNDIKKQFDSNNLSYERFSAVDGYTLPIINQEGEKFTGLDIKNNPSLLSLDNNYTVMCPSENINYHADSKILDRTLAAGELGCYCSHREIWLKMVKENIPYALIVEDDAILNDDFRNKFLIMLKYLPAKWDLIYFYIVQSPDKEFHHIYNNQYLKKIGMNGVFNTTTGYLINLETAKKLIKYSKNFTWPIDDVMQQAVIHKEVQAYVTIPFLIKANQISENSIIFEMGRPH